MNEGRAVIQQTLDTVNSRMMELEEIRTELEVALEATDRLDTILKAPPAPKEKPKAKAKAKKSTSRRQHRYPRRTSEEKQEMVMQHLLTGENDTVNEMEKVMDLGRKGIEDALRELVATGAVERYKMEKRPGSGNTPVGRYRLTERAREKITLHLGMTRQSLTKDEARAMESGERGLAASVG